MTFLQRMGRRGAIATAVVVFALVLGFASPAAAAGCEGSARDRGDSATAEGYCVGATPNDPIAPSSSNLEGRYNFFCEPDLHPYEAGFTVQLIEQARIGGGDESTLDEVLVRGWDPSGTYAAHVVICYDGAGNVIAQWDPYWITLTEPVDPTVLRDDALAKIDFPEPEIDGMTALTHAVQLESWFWVDNEWEELSDSSTQGLVTVDVFATPDRVIYATGDGETFDCEGEPVEWTDAVNDAGTTCGHIYTSGTADEPGLVYMAEATIEWELSWAINGVDQGVFGTGDAVSVFEIPVGEVQIVEVR